jgi:hypothetical protein
MKKLIVLSIIAAFAAFSNLNGVAADKPAPAEKGEKKAPRHIPFHGKIGAVDKEAKTLKVGERTFHVTATTKIVKAGKPASFDDATVGEEVGGSYQSAEGGKLEVMSLRVGPKPAVEEKK